MGDRAASAAPPRNSAEHARSRTALTGAMFLMATSAIGPGFITQTTLFTEQLGAAFACAIVISILVDIAVQLNVWRVIGVSQMRAHELGNRVLPGIGHALSVLVVLGGLVFNIANVAGTGLGLNALVGLDPRLGGVISAVVALAIFASRRAGIAMDRIVVVLGAVMIGMTVYVAVISHPPLLDATRQTVAPDKFDFLTVVTLIGGTVGGYITYSGAHRLVDSGQAGLDNVRAITRGSVLGVIVTGVMRVLLFLAVLGVVAGGAVLSKQNAPASAFQHAAGQVGLRLFGVIMWAAALTSVIGSAYTSVSFLSALTKSAVRRRDGLIAAFIAVSTIIYLLINQPPANLLVLAGAVNGLILPVGVGVLLWVALRRSGDLLGGYHYPRWLFVIGVLVWLLTLYLGWNALSDLSGLWS